MSARVGSPAPPLHLYLRGDVRGVRSVGKTLGFTRVTAGKDGLGEAVKGGQGRSSAG